MEIKQAVLISIRPKWCKKIISGEKKVEVRKTRPSLAVPFRCYVYCTRGKPDLNIPITQERLMRDYLDTGSMRMMNCPSGNGKIIGEFVCHHVTNLFANSRFWLSEEDVLHTCLNSSEIQKYSDGAEGLYGWHISDVRIYDVPRELSELVGLKILKDGYGVSTIERPPQSWRYVAEMQGGK